MKIPMHPGDILKEYFIVPDKMTTEELADAIGVPKKDILDIVNQKKGISQEIASSLSISLETPPDYWIKAQRDYDVFMDNIRMLIDKIERNIIEVKGHFNEGNIKKAAAKSKLTKMRSDQLFETLNNLVQLEDK